MARSARDFFDKYRDVIPDYEDFVESLRGPLPSCLRINTLFSDPQRIVSALRAIGVELIPTPLGPEFWLAPQWKEVGRSPFHCFGLIYSQALSSGIPPVALSPGPEDLVLDLCAAPGSKTTQMAALMRNRGRIVANDPSPRRITALVANLRRMGVSNAVVTAYAGQNFPMRVKFDKILVDVPCSGEGKARMGPDGELLGTSPNSPRLHEIQVNLVLKAFDLLKKGGTLVYSTCSYDPMENEAVLDMLLKERPARIVPIGLPIPYDPGIQEWKGLKFSQEVRNAWRIYPHRLRTVGFFVAKVCKG